MEILKNKLCEILKEYGSMHYYYGIKKYNIAEELMQATNIYSSISMKERFYLVLNTCKKPKCLQCNDNYTIFKNINHGYHKFCSSKCVEIYKRNTVDINGDTLSKNIGNKIRLSKKEIMSNGLSKGQNARKKQLIPQMLIDEHTGLKGTELIARKGVETLIAKGTLKTRGEKIKYIKENNIDALNMNGYDRASKSMSITKRKQYQELCMSNKLNIENYYLYFFVSGDTIKIGVSKNYVLRKKYLERKMGINITINELYMGTQKEILILEYNIHNLLASYNIVLNINIDGKTEWFLKKGFMVKKCKIDDEIKKYKVRRIEI